MNNKDRKMEVMAMPNTRAYVMRSPNRDKAIKLEAYKEFVEKLKEKGKYAMPYISLADVYEVEKELEAKLNEEM